MLPAGFSIGTFMSYVRIDNETDCWHWSGKKSPRGYAIYVIKRKTYVGHKLSYLYKFGEYDDKTLELGHTCKNKCVSPMHVRPVTKVQNQNENGQGLSQTHCYKGHERTPENLRVYRRKNGNISRTCLICQRERRKATYFSTGR